ncbi:hypothetical protein U1Q18_028149 [Sarracenia purpurea var. burkii]
MPKTECQDEPLEISGTWKLKIKLFCVEGGDTWTIVMRRIKPLENGVGSGVGSGGDSQRSGGGSDGVTNQSQTAAAIRLSASALALDESTTTHSLTSRRLGSL